MDAEVPLPSGTGEPHSHDHRQCSTFYSKPEPGRCQRSGPEPKQVGCRPQCQTRQGAGRGDFHGIGGCAQERAPNDRSRGPGYCRGADRRDGAKTRIGLGPARQAARGPGFAAEVDNVATFTERLRKIGESGELDRVVRNIDEAVQRLDGMLGDNQYDVRTILQDLRVTANNLRTLSETVKRYPAGALIGGPPEKVVLPKDSK